MSLFGTTKKNKIIAVLEISSASASGAFVSVDANDKNKLPKIISSVRAASNFLLDIDFQAFLRCSRESLKKVMQDLLKDYKSGPDAVICIFHSPWFVSQTKTINIQRKEQFKITDSFFNDVLKTEEENFRTNWVPHLAPLEGKPEFIEHELIKVDLNGYYVESPVGKTAKTVSANVYMSLGIKEVREMVEKLILENFGNIPKTFKTYPLTLFKVLRSVLNEKEGFVFAHIGDETTDICLVRNYTLEESISFPRGVNSVLRKIATEFNVFPEEAISILNTYLKGHKEDEQAKKILELMEIAEKEWLDFLIKALSCLAHTAPLPQNLFWTGDDVVATRLIKSIEEDQIAPSFTILGKPLEIRKLSPNSLAHHLGSEKDLLEKTRSCLMLAALYASKTSQI